MRPLLLTLLVACAPPPADCVDLWSGDPGCEPATSCVLDEDGDGTADAAWLEVGDEAIECAEVSCGAEIVYLVYRLCEVGE